MDTLHKTRFDAISSATAQGIGNARAFPRSGVRAATVLYLAILLAGTKFRVRDADASLNGQFDAQVLMELALYAVVLVVLFVRSRRYGVGIRGWRTAGDYLLWAYLAWASFSVTWSAAPVLTLVRAGQLLTVLLLARATVRELGPGAAVRAFSSAVVGFVAVCAIVAALFPWASDPELHTDGDFVRFGWFAVHPVLAATELGLALVLLTADVQQRPERWRTRWFMLPAWMLAAFLGTALVVTYSRGPLIACAVGVAALVLRSVRHQRIAIKSVAIAVVAMTAVLLFADVDVGAVLEEHAPAFFLRGQDADALTSFTGRLDLWQSMLPEMVDHFWFGYGYQASRATLLEAAEWAGYAHNAFLQSMLDVGIVGTLLLLSAIATTFLPSRSPVRARELIGSPFIPVMLFLLVNSITSESFAASPGVETLAVFTTVLAAAQHRGDARYRMVMHRRRSQFGAETA
jgi:O-antigen ligase